MAMLVMMKVNKARILNKALWVYAQITEGFSYLN